MNNNSNYDDNINDSITLDCIDNSNSSPTSDLELDCNTEILLDPPVIFEDIDSVDDIIAPEPTWYKSVQENNEPMLKVFLVCGFTNTGKSTYIAKTFGEDVWDVIDIYNFQNPASYPVFMPQLRQLMLSYALHTDHVQTRMKDFKEQVNRYEKLGSGKATLPASNILIIEGTYVKRCRRLPLIQDIRNTSELVNLPIELNCIWVEPNEEIHPMKHFLKRSYSVAEEPILEEGYDTIEIYKATDEYVDEEIKNLVKCRKMYDPITEEDLLGYQFIKNHPDNLDLIFPIPV